MLSKRNVKLRAKTKVVQQRRQWLSKALDNAKECYNETLSVFKLRLDDIVSAPLENAEKLLEEPNEDVFISKVFNAATAIEKCTDELLQLNMQLYETFESDYDDDAESETLERFIENSQVQCSDPKESLNGEATKKNDSDTACLDISMNNGSLREKYEYLSSNNPHDKSSSSLPETRTELLACADFQKIFPTSSVDSPQVSSKATDINNGPSLNQYNEPWPYDETNFLLHHNIKYEQKVSVVISDISSPGLFSVHSEIGREKLMILQKDLNEMYSKASTEKLKFKDSPVADTLCVSLFPVDKVWYRAIILSLIDSNKCEVVYVDYGNQAVVTNDSIRQIVPEFADTPPLSIFCCLSGIQPSHNNNHSNDTDDNKEWSTECMDWFCSYGLENSFVAVFLRSDSDGGSTVGGCGFSVNLFEASTSSNGQVILNSVAAKLVSLGYARYTEIQSTIASNHFHSPSCGNGVEKIEMSASSSFDDTKRPQLKSDLDVKAENFAPETPEEPTSTDTAVILPCEEQHLDESPQETSAKPCSVSSIPVTSANTDKSEDDQSDTLSMHASDLMFSSTTDSTTSTLQPSSKSTISLVKPALPGQQESSVDLLEDESKAECGVAEESERLSPGPTKDQLVTDNNEHNSSFEYDLVLLLNIEYDQIVPVEISDVRSPGRFSVQSETGSEQLIQLQRLLNEMGSNQMEMVNDPEVGTICAALFLQDSRWYRAKILSVLGNDEFKVCYIDYGNSDVLHKKHLRILDASYAEFVPLSISCSLFGVEPNTSGSSEGPKQWSDSSINWFNTYVVGKKFSAQFLKNSGGNVYEVNLFHVSTSADNHENLWDVSQTLVFLGHAIFCDKLKKVSDNFSHVLPCIVDEKTSSPTSNGSVIISPETENKSVLESNQSFYLSSRNDTSSPLHSTPVIVEDTLRGISPVSCPVNVPTTCTSSLSCNSYPLNAQLSQSFLNEELYQRQSL